MNEVHVPTVGVDAIPALVEGLTYWKRYCDEFAHDEHGEMNMGDHVEIRPYMAQDDPTGYHARTDVGSPVFNITIDGYSEWFYKVEQGSTLYPLAWNGYVSGEGLAWHDR